MTKQQSLKGAVRAILTTIGHEPNYIVFHKLGTTREEVEDRIMEILIALTE